MATPMYVVLLERTSVDPLIVNYVLRADVPAQRQPFFADPSAVSADKTISAEDLGRLRSGALDETARTGNFSGMTLAQIRTALQAEQAAFQAATTADGPMNQWKFYGTCWDGTTWTAKGVS